MTKVTAVIAIFDIGKTNKKLFLFDEDYKIVLERSAQFEEITDEDGDACEDVDALIDYIKSTFEEIQSLEEFDIKAVNFSGYGASFVGLDADGKISIPLYNYLKPFPEDLKRQFYETYGSEEKIALETASPTLGNLNSGMQLYRLKHDRPEQFQKVKQALHFPQFLSYLLNGEMTSDITSLGSHTQLWDFRKDEYHDWVRKEGIDKILPPIKPSDTVFEKNNIQIGIGLHDSSAALIPYLASFSEPFVLISTGTWCITLNPFNESPLTAAELQKDCLCYLAYTGKTVKASRLFAGQEHEDYIALLAKHFGKEKGYYKTVKYQAELTGDTPVYQNLHEFDSYERAYHHFMHHLVKEQIASTNLVLQSTKTRHIYVDGGFGRNPIYMNLLAKAYPQMKVYAASVAQASALGAALAIHDSWNGKAVSEELIKLLKY